MSSGGGREAFVRRRPRSFLPGKLNSIQGEPKADGYADSSRSIHYTLHCKVTVGNAYLVLPGESIPPGTVGANSLAPTRIITP